MPLLLRKQEWQKDLEMAVMEKPGSVVVLPEQHFSLWWSNAFEVRDAGFWDLGPSGPVSEIRNQKYFTFLIWICGFLTSIEEQTTL